MVRRILGWLGIVVLVVAYPLLAHYTNQAHSASLGALVAIAPVVLIALAFAWRSPHYLIMVGVIALTCIALWAGWSRLEQNFGLVYWLQHVGMQLILLMMFGRTLIAGRQPLCTRFAEALHAPLSPQHERYARQVTGAWTLFFAAMAIISSLLFFLAPLPVWSIFANFLTLPLVALMFIVEYWLRKWLLPEMRHAHFMDAIRAFRDASARPR